VNYSNTVKRAACVVFVSLMAFPIQSGAETAEEATAEAPQLPRARLCTAKAGNNYHRFGLKLRDRLKGVIDVRVLATLGSWENLELIDENPRRCDAIIAQEDAYTLYRFEKTKSDLTMDRTATLFSEYVHLLCGRGVAATSFAELDPEKTEIVVNKYGSGSYITWRLFRRLNPDHKKYKMIEKGVDDAMLRILDMGRPGCFFYVSGLGGTTLSEANGVFGDQLKLITVQDPKQERPVGADKRQIYRSAELPADSYSKLAPKGLKTHSVSAVFFTSPEWKARHPKASLQLSSALLTLIKEGR
jgi:TRAP-type uncharacterized transport system substrate-binding protein